jgi:hypothetical protein
MAYTLQRQGVGIESIPESGVDHMKTNKVVTCLTSLSFAIVFFTSSFATAQQTEAEQHDRIANEEQLERARAAMEECANAPNNVGQGAEENVRPGNPNAPADIQGSRNQQNPGSERSDVVTAQIEDNCRDAHEDPSTNENAREQNPRATDVHTDTDSGV